MSETSSVVTPTWHALNGIPRCVCHRLHSGMVKVRRGYMHQNEPGTPDLLAIVGTEQGPVPVYFECKAPKGLVSEDQLAFHARARRAGAVVVVIRKPSAAVDVVRKILSGKSALEGAMDEHERFEGTGER